MKVYRNGVRICIFLCSISLLAMLLVQFSPIIPAPKAILSYSEKINETMYDFSLGIFASAFVVLITTLGSYFIDKKKNVGLLKHYCCAFILELSDLVGLLQEADDTDKYLFDIYKFKGKITSIDIHEYIKKLTGIHDESLMNVGFYPFCRKNRNNLDIHKLIIAFARINSAIQYFDCVYKTHNSSIYKAEVEDFRFDFTDDELIKYVDIILQSHGNDEYKAFLGLLQKLMQKSPTKTVYTIGCEDKCL